MKLYKKICRNCGKEFEGVYQKHYCSDICQRRHAQNTTYTYKCVCVVCGKEFRGSNNTVKCCSEECRIKLRETKKEEKRIKKAEVNQEKHRKYLLVDKINRDFRPTNDYGRTFKKYDNLTQDAIVARNFRMDYGDYQQKPTYEKEAMRRQYIQERC